MKQTDVDIDCFGRDTILDGLEHIAARIDRADSKFERHPTGLYFQNIPRNPMTNVSTLDHRIADQHGYFKIDLLNVNFYENVKDEEHLTRLLNQEPDWDIFLLSEITDQLFHLNGYSRLLVKYKPRCVEDIAMILAIIRPSKAFLQQAEWSQIRDEVWQRVPGDETYQFKRSHGIAYALAIIVNLNLLVESLLDDNIDIMATYLKNSNDK